MIIIGIVFRTAARRLVSLAVGASLIAGCRGQTPDPHRFERALLSRQVEELERLVRAGREGALPRFDQGLIVVHESLLHDLLAATLPYESRLGDSYRARVLSATVSCEDGLALVRLHGRASFADRPEQDAFVEMNVVGDLSGFVFRPEERMLRGRVNVIGVELKRVEIGGGEQPEVRGLLRDLADLRLQTYQKLDYSFGIPVRLVDSIHLPEIESEGGVRVAETRIPLQVAVDRVTALRRRLWISIRLRSESRHGEPPAPTAARATP